MLTLFFYLNPNFQLILHFGDSKMYYCYYITPKFTMFLSVFLRGPRRSTNKSSAGRPVGHGGGWGRGGVAYHPYFIPWYLIMICGRGGEGPLSISLSRPLFRPTSRTSPSLLGASLPPIQLLLIWIWPLIWISCRGQAGSGPP